MKVARILSKLSQELTESSFGNGIIYHVCRGHCNDTLCTSKSGCRGVGFVSTKGNMEDAENTAICSDHMCLPCIQYVRAHVMLGHPHYAEIRLCPCVPLHRGAHRTGSLSKHREWLKGGEGRAVGFQGEEPILRS
jgi:hypothetical protein